MPTSTVPDAIDALLTLLTAALPDVDVHDGPPMKGDRPDWVAVGYDPSGDEFTAVDSWTQEARGLGQQGREERFDILCSLGSSSGNPSMSARRDRAFALLAEVETVLRADGDLSGAVRFGELTTGTYTQEQTQQGATAGIAFRITVQARV